MGVRESRLLVSRIAALEDTATDAANEGCSVADAYSFGDGRESVLVLSVFRHSVGDFKALVFFFWLLRSEEKGPGWTNMLGSGCRTPGEHWSRSFERLEKRDQRIAIEVGFRDLSHRAGRLAKQEGLQVGIEVPVCAETMPARMAEKAKMAERMVDCSPFPAEAILAVYAMSTDESVSEKQVNKDEGNGQEEKQIARTRTKDLIRPKVRYRTGAVRPFFKTPESRVHGQS